MLRALGTVSRTRFALFVVLALVLARTAGAAPTSDTVRVAFQPLQSHGGLFIAEREGHFAAERIKIDWIQIQTGGRFVPLLAQGHLDVGAGALSAAFFNAVAAEQPVRVVADKGHVASRGSLGSLLVRKELAGSVRSAADLKDRRVAISGPGGLAHYLLSRALAAHRMTVGQVSLLQMPSPSMVAALKNGGVDAALVPVPFDAVAIETNVAFRLMDLAEILPGEHTAFLFYGSRLLEASRPLGVRFMTAYLRGLKQYNDGPTARNVEIVADYTKVDAATLRKGGWIGIHADGHIDVARLRRFQDWLFDVELIHVRNPVAKIVDLAFVEQARSALGLPTR